MKSDKKKQEKLTRTRALILKNALQILEKEGVDSVTLRAIAHKMDVSVGVIYNYFTNKDEILKEIYVQTSSQFLKALKKREIDDKNKNPFDAFVEMAVFMCEFRIENSHRYREIFFRQTFEEEPKELLEIRKHSQEKLKALSLAALKTDEDLYLASRVVLSLAEGIASLALRDITKDARKKSAKTMELGITALLNGWS
jgi:AcrR family transcriptional regulator